MAYLEVYKRVLPCPTLPYPALLSNDRLTNSHDRHGPKSGGGAAVPLSVEGAGFPSNTVSTAPRPTSVPSALVIRPDVSS